MAEFEITDAALSGLRLIARRPKVLPYWIGFNVVVVAIALVVFFGLFGDFFRQLMEVIASGSEQPPTALLLSLIPRIGLMLLIFLPFGLLTQAIRQGAAARAILWPDDDRYGYLRVGADEFRLMLVIFVLGLINAAIQFVFSIVGAIILVAVLAASGGLGSGEGARSVQGLQQLIQLPMYAVMVFIFLKLCLAVPQTMDSKAINIFGSWSLTKGHTGRMFLSYLIVILISIGFGILTAALMIGFVIAAGGGAMMTIIPQFETNPQEAIRGLFGMILPVAVGVGIVSAIVTPIFTALIYCPAAYIYGRISGRTEDVF
jgi:hypothetical protein